MLDSLLDLLSNTGGKNEKHTIEGGKGGRQIEWLPSAWQKGDKRHEWSNQLPFEFILFFFFFVEWLGIILLSTIHSSDKDRWEGMHKLRVSIGFTWWATADEPRRLSTRQRRMQLSLSEWRLPCAQGPGTGPEHHTFTFSFFMGCRLNHSLKRNGLISLKHQDHESFLYKF